MKTLNSLKLLRPLLFCLMAGCSAAAGVANDSDESVTVDGQIGQTSQAVTQSTIAWWKGLWQTSRDTLIFWRATSDLTNPPKYVGLDCKDWARKVVSDASQGVVSLPSTSTVSDWTWGASPYVQNVGSIYGVVSGNIVQMHRNSTGVHTAIVYGNDGKTITWIDSNWSTPPDDKVREHSETIANFISAVTSGGVQKYTAYRITGG
jgi:hypothetical protein